MLTKGQPRWSGGQGVIRGRRLTMTALLQVAVVNCWVLVLLLYPATAHKIRLWDCPAGTYSNTWGKPPSCTSCPAGTYRPYGASYNLACSSCPMGTFSTATGASSSSTCEDCDCSGDEICFASTGCVAAFSKPSTGIAHSEHAYVPQAGVTHAQARDACAVHGAALASINDAAENAHVLSLLGGSDFGGAAWLSFTRKSSNLERPVWADFTSPITPPIPAGAFDGWLAVSSGEGQPNGWVNGTDQFCGTYQQLASGTGQKAGWNDEGCDYTGAAGFVCERGLGKRVVIDLSHSQNPFLHVSCYDGVGDKIPWTGHFLSSVFVNPEGKAYPAVNPEGKRCPAALCANGVAGTYCSSNCQGYGDSATRLTLSLSGGPTQVISHCMAIIRNDYRKRINGKVVDADDNELYFDADDNELYFNTFPAVPQDSYTFVEGQCTDSPISCGVNAQCKQLTEASYTCTCNDGFNGDGFTCVVFSRACTTVGGEVSGGQATDDPLTCECQPDSTVSVMCDVDPNPNSYPSWIPARDGRSCRGVTFKNCPVTCSVSFGCYEAIFEGTSRATCTGERSCDNANLHDTSSATCTADDSCWNANLHDTSSAACTGVASCYDVRLHDTSSATCTADDSCWYANLHDTSRAACTGVTSCSYAHLYGTSRATCTGERSCYYADLHGTSSAACTGVASGSYADLHDTSSAACTGDASCWDVRLHDTSSAACTADDSCWYANLYDTSSAACTGVASCSYADLHDTSSAACTGDASCWNAHLYGTSRATCSGGSSCWDSELYGDSIAKCETENACGDLQLCAVFGEHRCRPIEPPSADKACCIAVAPDGVCPSLVSPCADDDNDLVANHIDNCPDISNGNQEDIGNNGIGDACEVVLTDEENDDFVATVDGSLYGAVGRNNEACGSGGSDDPTVTYRFIAPSDGTLTAGTCDGNDDLVAQFAVLTESPAADGTFSCVAAGVVDHDASCSTVSEVSVTGGVEYSVQVFAAAPDAQRRLQNEPGAFTLIMSFDAADQVENDPMISGFNNQVVGGGTHPVLLQ